jgi:alpha-mannosidase
MLSLVEVFLAGNAHIDPVWLWRWFEGFWTVRYTVRRIVELMKKNPSLTFVFSSAIMYEWLEECEPELFEEVKRLIKEGRWIPVGGWVVEPDCNIPCGESYVRHALYGKMYFRERLGFEVKIGYNIDSFGHNASLPQILRKSCYEYYIFMRPGSHEKDLPSPVFWWESLDGSRILTYRHPFSYTISGEKLYEAIKSVVANQQMPVLLILFGAGDHGGGPTENDIKAIHKASEENVECRITFADPEKFFKRALDLYREIPVVRGELQHHASGCYSVLSEVKALNRRAESMVMAAERMSVLAYVTCGLNYPKDRLKRSWKLLLFCQFHDILAGTCIPEAYWDIRNIYGESLNIAYEALNLASQYISSKIDTNKGRSLVVFNPSVVQTKFPVEVEPWFTGYSLVDDGGRRIPIQKIRPSSTAGLERALFIADVPSLGYRTYRLIEGDSPLQELDLEGILKISDRSIENDYFIMEVDSETGAIKTLYDKRLGVNIFDGYGASPIVLKDEGDTWGHRISKFRFEEGRFGNAEISIVESGPIRATLRVKTSYHNSTIWQYFSLYRGLDFIEVRVRVDWREKKRMLKLSFPVNLEESTVTYEIPYGTIVRPANGEEEPGQRWVDISGKIHVLNRELNYGLTVINDSKYGFDTYGSEIRMSVLRSPLYAQHDPHKADSELEDYLYIDRGEQSFRYILLPHLNNWADNFGRIFELAEMLNTGLFYVFEEPHAGSMPNKLSLLEISPSDVAVSAVKLAEDSNDVIVRLVEYTGRDRTVRIKFTILERDLSIHIKPFEIKTLRIPLDREKPIVECDLTENPLR